MSGMDSVRIPPNAVDAEQAVLGGLMLDPKALPRVAAILAEADFYRRDHQLIYRAILELAERRKPHDAVTLGDWFEANGLAEQIGGPGYLIELANTTPSAANIGAYAEIVRDKAMLRRLIEAGTGIVNDAFQPDGREVDEVLAEAAARIASVAPTAGARAGARDPKAAMKAWFEALQLRAEAPGRLVGLPTPWQRLNAITRGLRPGRLYVLAGRPSMGKSVLGIQLATFTACRGDRAALFSLEMTDEEVRERCVSLLQDVPQDWLTKPDDDDAQWSRVTRAVATLVQAPLYVDDAAGLTADQIAYRALGMHLDAPLKLVVVDHLHELRIDPDRAVDSYGDACRRLKALAKEIDAPVLLIAQLNRAAGVHVRRPTLTDLRASGRIEEVADGVLFIHRDDYYAAQEGRESDRPGVIELIVAKGRGFRAGDTVYLRNRYDVARADDWDGPLPRPPEPSRNGRARGYGSSGFLDRSSPSEH